MKNRTLRLILLASLITYFTGCGDMSGSAHIMVSSPMGAQQQGGDQQGGQQDGQQGGGEQQDSGSKKKKSSDDDDEDDNNDYDDYDDDEYRSSSSSGESRGRSEESKYRVIQIVPDNNTPKKEQKYIFEKVETYL